MLGACEGDLAIFLSVGLRGSVFGPNNTCSEELLGITFHAAIEEGRTTGGYEPPHRAVYSIAVSGCGKRTTYDISCDDRWKNSCVVGTVQSPARE